MFGIIRIYFLTTFNDHQPVFFNMLLGLGFSCYAICLDRHKMLLAKLKMFNSYLYIFFLVNKLQILQLQTRTYPRPRSNSRVTVVGFYVGNYRFWPFIVNIFTFTLIIYNFL